jgi:amino acid adenylation domain-containing protein
MSYQFRRGLGETQEGGGAVSEVFQAASKIKAGDLESWYREWKHIADRNNLRGDEALKVGHVRTAMNCWLRAANYYREAEFWLDAFADQARLHPDKTAVIAGSTSVTYGGLEYQAEAVKSALHAQGIGKGHYVGVGFHRSIGLIASLIGIVKSGAAYVPLDPSYPADRIARMLASAKLDTVITSPDLAAAFPGVKIICPSDSVSKTAEPAFLQTSGEDPIYAIFTSGSTGHPKAASVFHSGFSNLLEWYRAELQIGADDRTLVISSPSFDLTQKNLFTPLLTGGTLVLDDCQSYDITRILGLIQKHGITLINCTPSAFYPLVDAAGADFAALASLRFAVLGGEPISIPRLRAWLKHPACRAEVVNSYGPTECTDICLFHRMHRANLDDFPFVPLGREIPNAKVSIRDEMLNIMPDGETGELCIGGTGVGAGYLFDPKKPPRSL